jgi:hypothetical protein
MDPDNSLLAILKCPICLTQFDLNHHTPKILTCGHNVCSNSLKMIYANKSVKCPQCRADNAYESIEKVATNFGLQEMIKAFQGKNFIMIGSQPIVEQLQRTAKIIQQIHEANAEIEYFFEQQVARLQKEKREIL